MGRGPKRGTKGEWSSNPLRMADMRRKKRIDFLKLRRELKPDNYDEKTIKKVMDKVGAEGIKKILQNKDRSGESIAARLHQKINKQQANQIKSMLNMKTMSSFNPESVSYKFCFPFRGAWFFDIIVNHKWMKNLDTNLHKYFATFINGNTSFARVYVVNKKDKTTIKGVYNQFINDCKNLQTTPGGNRIRYPVKRIISDNDSAIPDSNEIPGVEIIKITQSGTAHGALSKMNAFASALRKENKEIQYISQADLNDFLDGWNYKKVPFVNCTRIEAMEDPELEEAYIAACSSENAEVKAVVDESFKQDNLVRVKETDDAFRTDPQKWMKEKEGTYKIVSNNNGELSLVNIHDPNDVITRRARHITRIGVSGEANLNRFIQEHGELPEKVPEVQPQVIMPKMTERERKENEREAEVRRKSTTFRRAQENLELQEGEDNLNRPKQLLPSSWSQLTQAERTELVKRIVDEDIEDNFDLGFITGYTEEERYKMMEEFANKIDPKFHAQLFGDVEFFSKKQKKLGPKHLKKLGNNIHRLAKSSGEFRNFITSAGDIDDKLIWRALGGWINKNITIPRQQRARRNMARILRRRRQQMSSSSSDDSD